MAIGSEPEIGKTFTIWHKMTEEQRTMWFKQFRETAGADLHGGWAMLVYPKRKGNNAEQGNNLCG